MEFEKMPHIEEGGKNREKLLMMEKSGKFVFHGSSDQLSILEPRQPFNKNEITGKMEPHGDPSVCATPYADIAIFRALINQLPKSSSEFGINGKELYFAASQNLIDNAKGKHAKVYVLDKSKFHEFSGMEWRSEEDSVPIEVIEVDFDDLPKNIRIVEINETSKDLKKEVSRVDEMKKILSDIWDYLDLAKTMNPYREVDDVKNRLCENQEIKRRMKDEKTQKYINAISPYIYDNPDLTEDDFVNKSLELFGM